MKQFKVLNLSNDNEITISAVEMKIHDSGVVGLYIAGKLVPAIPKPFIVIEIKE